MDKFILIDTANGAEMVNTSHIIRITNLHGDGSLIILSDGNRIISSADFKRLDDYLKCEDFL